MIQTRCSTESAVLYWDLPESFIPGNRYIIRQDGAIIGDTEKCHFYISGLKAETSYTFQVDMVGASKTLVGKETITTEADKHIIDVTKAPYHAIGDGKTLNTKALQSAIDDCKAGECVYLPAGDYMTGSLFLHSDMELRLHKDAILHGTVDVKDYEPKIPSRFEGHEMMCYAALLNVGELNQEKGIICSNVTITGGTICGGGFTLAKAVINIESVLMKDYIDSLGDKIKECEKDYTIPGRVRPRLVNISCAENVVLANTNIQNGASWNVHMIYSDNIVTYGCRFQSEKVWNGDGWDPDSSTNCTIFDCEFSTGDDAVAIKSGKNPEGNIINRPCEHIRVFDCISHSGHGITMGSEMSGGINDVRIWNCDMSNSVFGVEIKATKKRGGYVRNVQVRNSKLCRVMMHSVGYNDDGEAAPAVPVFEDCVFEDLHLTGYRLLQNNDLGPQVCDAVVLAGFDTPGHFIKNVKFKNILINHNDTSRPHTLSLQCCEGLSFENITVK